MHSTNKLPLSRQSVDRLLVADREIVYWDRHLPGFGVRVHATGSKVYIAHARSGGKTRRVTIGRHGAWSTERARREAGALIADIKAGRTPGRPGADSASATGPTIAELADDYMTWHVALRCKPSTQRSCRHILDRFLLPRFGALRVGEITPDHVAALHYRLRETPIMANQTVSLLSRLFLRAAASGNAPPGGNPCRFIRKYPARSRERFLSEQEYDRRRARRTRKCGPGSCQRRRGDPPADADRLPVPFRDKFASSTLHAPALSGRPLNRTAEPGEGVATRWPTGPPMTTRAASNRFRSADRRQLFPTLPTGPDEAGPDGSGTGRETANRHIPLRRQPEDHARGGWQTAQCLGYT